jgi:hypothetical protein
VTSSEFYALLAAIALPLVGLTAGAVAYFTSRRSASGRVSTSEASVLWQQSQAMRDMMLAEKTKAEEQRDRLIEAYTTQVFPVLTQINTAVTSLTAAVAEDVKLSREVLQALKGGGHVVPTPTGGSNANSQ